MPEKPPITILLVDDDPLIRRLGKELLEHLGYRVATAADGPEALRWYQGAGPADLVILDYHLPGMDGCRVLQELSSLDAGVRVLMASGTFSSQEVALFQEGGAVGLIYKPYRLTELDRRIKAVLAGEPGW